MPKNERLCYAAPGCWLGFSFSSRVGLPRWRHPERSRFSGGGRDLPPNDVSQEIPRPAGKNAGPRDDASENGKIQTELLTTHQLVVMHFSKRIASQRRPRSLALARADPRGESYFTAPVSRRRRRNSFLSSSTPFIGIVAASRNTASSRAVPCCHSASKPCRYSDRS